MLSLLDSLKIFKNAIQAVLQDEGFNVPSNEAAHALEAAGILNKWTADSSNEAACLKFCDQLCYNLLTIFYFTSQQRKYVEQVPPIAHINVIQKVMGKVIIDG